MEFVDWFGRGPGESYTDKREAARFGRFKERAGDSYENYIFPQESGSHAETRFAGITDRRGLGLAILGKPAFSFSANRYTTEDLQKAQHHHELVKRDEICLNIDARQHGIGSASCGPYVADEYQMKDKKIDFAFTLKPWFAEDADLETL